MTAAQAFTGFSTEAIQFLADLAANNDRAWFQPRKAEFERLLKQPLEALCTTLSVRLAERGVPLDADPARSPFRIYRDTRFSKDKSPYKAHVSASFPWRAEPSSANASGDTTADGPGPGGGERHGGVGGYFHLQPGEVFVGGGMWHPETARLAAWRRMINEDPGGVRAALEDATFNRTFGRVEGERLKRVPTGFAADHPEAELLKLKDVTFGRRLSDADVTSAALPDLLAADFAAAMPVFRLLAMLPA